MCLRVLTHGKKSWGSQEEPWDRGHRASEGLGVRNACGMKHKLQQDQWSAVALKEGLSVGRRGWRSRQCPFQMKLSNNGEEFGEAIRGLEARKQPYFLVGLDWRLRSEEIVGEEKWKWGQ